MHIKSNTNIVDMAKILERMETQDHEYENLLRKVDSLERELEMLNKDMDVTIQKEHQILSMDGGEQVATPIKYQGI